MCGYLPDRQFSQWHTIGDNLTTIGCTGNAGMNAPALNVINAEPFVQVPAMQVTTRLAVPCVENLLGRSLSEARGDLHPDSSSMQ